MKKYLKSFTIWFMVIGIIINIISLTNNDDMNILLIGLNPILNLLQNSKSIRDFILDNGFYIWNILSMITFILYGLLFDVIKNSIRQK